MSSDSGIKPPVRVISPASLWAALNRWRKQRNVRNFSTLGIVAIGPVLALVTYLALGTFTQGASSEFLRSILLFDLVYVLVIAALVLQRVAQMIAARRAKSAGSRLHLRLTGVFAIIALIPTILVAVFATFTLNFGLEGWFSDRVREVVGNSLAAAQAYELEHRTDLERDAEALASFLNQTKQLTPLLTGAELRQLLTQGQSQIQRGLREAYVIDGTATLKARGERSYLFDFEPPSAGDIEKALLGETVIIQDWDNNEFRALISLSAYVDRFLYVSRNVDGSILNLLDDTKETITLYQQLEDDRGRLLFEFGLIYLGFAFVVILAAVWLGLWFAERLARPVGRLAGAAQRVGAGDLDVKVLEDEGDDEIAMLARMFNRMTRELKGQRDALVQSHEQTERRRRLFDSVLTGVTAGVIGLTSKGKIEFTNAASSRLLGLDTDKQHGVAIGKAVPEFADLFAALRKGDKAVVQDEIGLTRAGSMENLLVRMATRIGDNTSVEGYVVTFDDVTDLVAAQRMAAWGDVARRIAHEIKNPLTPIQLSAERLKRKFAPLAGKEEPALTQYTDVIIRQTSDLRRIVDEFSKFARMPEPERRRHDLAKLISDAVVLQDTAMPDVTVTLTNQQKSIWAEFDSTMLSQALTNLIKNAGEAIESYVETGVEEDYKPEIRVDVETQSDTVEIRISDNGIGLPEQRARLFEPYVTTRDKGTGLGLPIVKKIIEEHGGTLELLDAPAFEGAARNGAMARIRLPMTGTAKPDIESAKGS